MHELIQKLIDSGVLKTQAIIDAFIKNDRINFIREKDTYLAYADIPLPIGFDQTISQPTTVAYMLELLNPSPGDKILDVGSGSGWSTALLANIVGNNGKVIGIERIPELVEFGKNNLEKFKYSNAVIIHNDHELGYSAQAPYDKILVSASSDRLPQKLVDELKIGGSMVIPIGFSLHKIIKTSPTDIENHEFYGFSFVPLVYNI